MSLKISQKFLLAVSVPVIFELALVGTLFSLLSQADEARQREQQGRELANRTYALMGMHVQRVTQMAIYKSTDDPAMLAQARQSSQRMMAEIENIHKLVQSNPKSNDTWNKLDHIVRKIGEEHEQAAQCFKVGDKAGATMLYLSMRHHFEELLRLSDQLAAQQVSTEGLDISKYSESIRLVLYASILVSILTAFGLAIIFNRGTAKRLNVIMNNTERLAAGKAPNQRLTGNDELAQIDALYHKMHDSLTILRRRERAIMENVADVVCSIDSTLRFSDINEAAYKHWGYEEGSIEGGRAADLICGADRERVLGCLRKIIESGKEDRFECGIKRADNSIADTEWSVTLSQEEESLYCVIHDITARKNLERMKAEFVAMVSHEIRTPLSSIQMTHSLLESELSESMDPFMTKSLVVAKDNVTRLMALVNNLLDLDKLESGFIEFLPENEAAWQVVETSINAIESLFKKKSIEVKHNIDPNLYIYADKERLVQVLINLLGNAIKYSEPGSKITVKARKEGKAVRFSVTDTGRGIPADKLSTIFERFRQVEASDEKVHKGAGLGLAISKAIIERHKGKMGVDSTLGEGSTFWFTVPAGEGKLGD